MMPETLGHYRVIRSIGSGGMGEVFLAEDTKLGRQVALKVLGHALAAADPGRRDRFDREARAVAALNHPNIITIHSVEEHEGGLFLTMEFVDGKTLAELIPPQGMPIAQWLEVTIPLSDAVGAAHQRGITHRDLKPANIMVTGDGRLKVLDFGLAKLRDGSLADGFASTTTKAALTSEGRIVGTLAYMSPEQAEGKAVDARSDVFSLGVVLFEMATGERPFKGDTMVSLLSAIIKDEPAPVADRRADLPREVDRVIRRCLEKDPDNRYQTAKDLRNDLRSMKQELGAATTGPSGVSSGIGRREARVSPGRGRWLAGAGLVATAVLAAGWWWALGRSAASSSPAFAAIKPIRRLTNTGNARIAALSPDGRYVVHDDGRFDRPSLWMRQVSSASSVQIVPPAAGFYSGLTFTPDGESVLYVFTAPDSTTSLFQLPVLGGVPARRIMDDVATPPAFSVDGARMAFIRRAANGDRLIVVANANGTAQRLLRTRPQADPYSATKVAWSPDGRRIAAFAGAMPGHRYRVVMIDSETGTEEVFSEARFDEGGQITWLGDGSAIVFDANERYGGRWNGTGKIWSLSYPAGRLRQITQDVAAYSSVAADADGRTLVAVRNDVRASLWVVPDGDTVRAHPIVESSNGMEGGTGIDWTPDGRVVYSATTQGTWDIWIANGDGSGRRPLTSDPGIENQPRVTPDGKRVIFTARLTGASDVLVRSIGLDATNPQIIPTGGELFRGYVQVGVEHIYFRLMREGRPIAFKMPLGGGAPTPLFPAATQLPGRFELRSVSPDERWAVGIYSEPPLSGVAVVPVDGVGQARRYPYSYTPGIGFGATWAPAGNAFEDLVFRDGATNLWRFPLDGSAPRAVTSFPSDHIMNYQWSRDGRTLAVSRGAMSDDLVLIVSDDKKE